MAAVITFDVTEFRAAFPAFADPIKYPDARLQLYWDQATCYVSDLDYGSLQGPCRRLAINLMTAHLTAISDLIAQGQTSGVVQSSTIDKITVSLTPPPITDSYFAWWLSTTPYGQQLKSLLDTNSVGGFYVTSCGNVFGLPGSYGY